MKEQASEWLCDGSASRRKFKGDAAKLLGVYYFDAGLPASLEVTQDFQDPRFVTVAGLAELIADRCAQATEKL